MSAPSETDRLANLEAQVAHQTRLLDELNEIVRTQWSEIDKLTRSLTHLAERLLSIEEAERKGTPGDEPPPPHY